MLAEIRHQIATAGRHVEQHGIDTLPAACASIPIEVFGALQIDRPPLAEPLLRSLPTMPGDDVQLLWTGAAGHTLLAHSLSFVRMLGSYLPSRAGQPRADLNVLDFGCGWGRLLRLTCKYVRPSRLWGVDPWDRSIELCKEHRVLGNLRMSPWIPRELDIPEEMDVVYAFSVFTHLPEEVATLALRTLTRHLRPGGRVLISVRPVEYWSWHDFTPTQSKGFSRERCEREHSSLGFTFVPLDRPPIEGIIAYGDTSMTVEFAQRLAAPLRLIAVEWSAVDTLQLILIFEKP
jgi:SAM-dependent methyltransferase